MAATAKWIAAFVVAAVLLSACAAAQGPRQADRGPSGDGVEFASPRTYFEVQDRLAVGQILIDGTVRDPAPTQVVAAASGIVSDVAFGRGELVDVGAQMARLLPDPTEADELALAIGELEIQRLTVEEASVEDIAAAEAALEERQAELAARAFVVTSPARGLMGRARQNVEYRVSEGDVLFELSNPDNRVIEVDLRRLPPDSINVGAAVTVVGADEQVMPGRIDSLNRSDAIATVVTDLLQSLDLDDRVRVSLDPPEDDASSWVSADAIGRQGGQSYVLVEDADGSLRRASVAIGQRTLTHVQLLTRLSPGTRLVAPS